MLEGFFGRGVFADDFEVEFVVTVAAIDGSGGFGADEVDGVDEVLAMDAEVDGTFAMGFTSSDGMVMELNFHSFLLEISREVMNLKIVISWGSGSCSILT